MLCSVLAYSLSLPPTFGEKEIQEIWKLNNFIQHRLKCVSTYTPCTFILKCVRVYVWLSMFGHVFVRLRFHSRLFPLFFQYTPPYDFKGKKEGAYCETETKQNTIDTEWTQIDTDQEDEREKEYKIEANRMYREILKHILIFVYV